MTSNDLIKRSIIVGGIVTVVVAAVSFLWLGNAASTELIIAPVVFTVMSVLTIKVLTAPSLGALLKFSSAFMLTNFVKLLAYLVFFLVAYIGMPGEKRICFVVGFMLLYLIFAVLDTMTLLQYYKDKEKS